MKNFTIKLPNRISSDNSVEVDNFIFTEIRNNTGKLPIFDADCLEYISSSGLRIFLKAQKLFEEKLTIINVNRDVYDIFEMTGFITLFDIKRKMREFSVDGCRIIGQGASGTVYRLDSDTVIKVYNEKETLDTIKHETEMAKVAFVHGIPTAISYDIVKVGNNFGTIFEMLDAKTLNDVLIANPDDFDNLLSRYVDFVHLFHSKTIPDNTLPSAKDQYIGYIDYLKSNNMIDCDLYEKLFTLLNNLEKDNHLLHGDFHLKNIMVVAGELMIIDMDTLSVGQRIFDFAGLHSAYIMYEKDEPGNSLKFFGLPYETCSRFWNNLVKKYFDTEDEKEIEIINQKISVVSSICFLKSINNLVTKDKPINILRTKHTIEYLNSILPSVKDLNI